MTGADAATNEAMRRESSDGAGLTGVKALSGGTVARPRSREWINALKRERLWGVLLAISHLHQIISHTTPGSFTFRVQDAHGLGSQVFVQALLVVLVNSSPARTFNSRIRQLGKTARIAILVEGSAGCWMIGAGPFSHAR